MRKEGRKAGKKEGRKDGQPEGRKEVQGGEQGGGRPESEDDIYVKMIITHRPAALRVPATPSPFFWSSTLLPKKRHKKRPTLWSLWRDGVNVA